MTGMSDSLRLAELLCARLCHDLSGPLGALVGILEIAREEQPAGETLALADETANELVQRLRLLRAAWGQDSDDMDVARLRGFAECLSSSRRVLLDLAGLEPGATFPPPAARVVLNLLLLAAESLPGGGVVALSGSPAHSILMTISGPRAAWPAGLAIWLNDEAAAWEAMLADPRRLQGAAGRAACPWPRPAAVDADAGRPDGRRGSTPSAVAVAPRRIAAQQFTYCSSASDQDAAPPRKSPGSRGLPWTI